MNRWLWFTVCVVLGLGALVAGFWVPAHLRAVDACVLECAGKGTPSLSERGAELLRENRLGAAQMLGQVAQRQHLPGSETLQGLVKETLKQHPDWQAWGGPAPRLEHPGEASRSTSGIEPFTEFVVRLENRERVFAFLRASPRPSIRELLRFRSVTNTTIFEPSGSSAGQALDGALSTCGLLFEGGHFTAGLGNAVLGAVVEANGGGNPQPFELLLLDLMSLGQRCNWGQLVLFINRIEEPETLHVLTALARANDEAPSLLFAAIQLSGRPAAVAEYLTRQGRAGAADLASSLQYGAGGVRELLRRGQLLHRPPSFSFLAGFSARSPFAEVAWRAPGWALALKWILYFVAGLLLSLAAHFARPRASVLERPLLVPGFHVAREVLFALGFLLVVLLLSEPFLAQESQKVEFPLRLRLPTVGGAALAGNPGIYSRIMNQVSLLTLLLFFVLQALIYAACLFKLAEIRRQKVPPRIKLKLLDNEDHLFDAGLYLGFVGTIISLILVSLGVIQPSLMAAYSSTSFGIIFVSVFKIFNLRPVRRRLLLEAEASSPETFGPVVRPTPLAPS